MVKMTKIPLAEAKQMQNKRGRKPEFSTQYIGYLTKLERDKAGKIRIRDDKEGQAIRKRIERAALKLDLDVEIRKVGNEILFWKE